MIDTGFAGAAVLVTGGASGIGASVSRAFAKQWAKVAKLENVDVAILEGSPKGWTCPGLHHEDPMS